VKRFDWYLLPKKR